MKSPLDLDDPLIDEQEAARYLGCSPRTLQRMRATGEGPAFVKIGRLVKYRKHAHCDTYVASRTRTSTSSAA